MNRRDFLKRFVATAAVGALAPVLSIAPNGTAIASLDEYVAKLGFADGINRLKAMKWHLDGTPSRVEHYRTVLHQIDAALVGYHHPLT